MQMIRTTIKMPKDVHKNLKREAMDKEISLSDLLVEKVVKDTNSREETIAKRKEALRRIRELTKDVDFSGLDYKELVNHGRRY